MVWATRSSTMLSFMVPAIARRAPLHGYNRQCHPGVVAGSVASRRRAVYPALHRMEEAGWISAEWMVTEGKRRARVYRMTRAGTKQLAAETERWDVFSKGVARVLLRIRSARCRDGGGCVNGCVFLAADGIGFGLSRFALRRGGDGRAAITSGCIARRTGRRFR